MRRKTLGENYPDTATSYNDIGNAQSKLGDDSSALQSHQGALEILCKTLGENHPDVATSYNNVGIPQVALALAFYSSAVISPIVKQLCVVFHRALCCAHSYSYCI